MNFSPLTIRRVKNFRSNKRGFYSAIVFGTLFFATIFAEFIANDKPILVVFENKIHFPNLKKFQRIITEVSLKQKRIIKILSLEI